MKRNFSLLTLCLLVTALLVACGGDNTVSDLHAIKAAQPVTAQTISTQASTTDVDPTLLDGPWSGRINDHELFSEYLYSYE
jgi:hypothetical protein